MHATPLVEAIKRAVPDSRIIVASSGLASQVWEGNPHLQHLLSTPNPLIDPVGAFRALRHAELFGGEQFVTLLTTGNERTKLTLSTWFTTRTKRIGFAVHRALVQQHLTFDPALSQIENNLRLLPAAGIERAPEACSEPRIYPVRGMSFAENMLLPIPGPRIVLATQTSPTQRKSWLQDRWVELAHELHERYGAELIFIGTESESNAIDELRSRIAFRTTSIAGHTTIQELAAVLARCDLGIMLDTGPLHVARAMGLPAVIIAPAWSPVHEWLPTKNASYRILKHADFPPPAPADYVITEVSTAEVLQAAEELLIARLDTDAAFARR